MSENIVQEELTHVVHQGDIVTNIHHLKEQLEEQLEPYRDYKVKDETQVSEAKDVKSKLNKIKKMINDEKKDIKKEYMRPYTELETHVKEMMGDIEEVSGNIDKQVKQYEDLWKQDKYEDIQDFYYTFGLTEVSLDSIFDKKWLNKGTSEKKWKEQLTEKVEKIQNDLDWIEKDSNVDDVPRLKVDYLNNGFDTTKALQRYNDRAKVYDTDEEEYITIKKSRYDELLEIEWMYKELTK